MHDRGLGRLAEALDNNSTVCYIPPMKPRRDIVRITPATPTTLRVHRNGAIVGLLEKVTGGWKPSNGIQTDARPTKELAATRLLELLDAKKPPTTFSS